MLDKNWLKPAIYCVISNKLSVHKYSIFKNKRKKNSLIHNINYIITTRSHSNTWNEIN
jgi:hypothetical protein